MQLRQHRATQLAHHLDAQAVAPAAPVAGSPVAGSREPVPQDEAAAPGLEDLARIVKSGSSSA
jgi:hypothetical protein